MTRADALRSGKGHHDENFPVASRLIHPRHRAVILAFYEFVRTADDVADHPTLTEGEKLALLDRLEASLLGANDHEPAGVALRTALDARTLPPRHAQDLLTAFRRDASKLRYQDWSDLIDYCSYSAMPVGRFVLDVHGESRATWPANDALCAALQIINHLQDCRKDYRDLNRVYVPLDALAQTGAVVDELAGDRASPALLRCLHGLAARTDKLLEQSATFPALIDDARLSVEVSVIRVYAKRHIKLLMARDPLNQRVHLNPAGFFGFGIIGVIAGAARRFGRSRRASHKPQDA